MFSHTLALFALALLPLTGADWPMFRGWQAQGVAQGSIEPSWNADPSAGPERNILWKTPVPGLSHSSPILWGGRLYVATAIRSAGEAPLKVGLYGAGDPAQDDVEQQWVIYCLDRRNGALLWQRVAYQGKPRSRRHTKATHANTTLATDGRHIAAFFGSEGLYLFDMSGKLLWKKDLGAFDIGPQGYDLQWGNASSPVLHEDILVLQCDQKKGSFLAAFSVKDGRELWRTERDGVSNHSWATPAVVTAAGRTQIVCNGWPYITGYELATGKELWRLKSGGDIPVPTPVFAHNLIYVTNAHGGPAPLYAIKPDASGDISLQGGSRTSAGIAWSEPRNGAYMQTPLIVDDILYSCSDRGVLKAYDAKTGQLHYTQRLGSGTVGFSASPVAAGGRILLTSEEGEVYVIRHGKQYELLAVNKLGEIAMATPAIADGVVYFRTRGHVVAAGRR
jgi:outer membrane protein assembly factor BamB